MAEVAPGAGAAPAAAVAAEEAPPQAEREPQLDSTAPGPAASVPHAQPSPVFTMVVDHESPVELRQQPDGSFKLTVRLADAPCPPAAPLQHHRIVLSGVSIGSSSTARDLPTGSSGHDRVHSRPFSLQGLLPRLRGWQRGRAGAAEAGPSSGEASTAAHPPDSPCPPAAAAPHAMHLLLLWVAAVRCRAVRLANALAELCGCAWGALTTHLDLYRGPHVHVAQLLGSPTPFADPTLAKALLSHSPPPWATATNPCSSRHWLLDNPLLRTDKPPAAAALLVAVVGIVGLVTAGALVVLPGRQLARGCFAAADTLVKAHLRTLDVHQLRICACVLVSAYLLFKIVAPLLVLQFGINRHVRALTRLSRQGAQNVLSSPTDQRRMAKHLRQIEQAAERLIWSSWVMPSFYSSNGVPLLLYLLAQLEVLEVPSNMPAAMPSLAGADMGAREVMSLAVLRALRAVCSHPQGEEEMRKAGGACVLAHALARGATCKADTTGPSTRVCSGFQICFSLLQCLCAVSAHAQAVVMSMAYR